MSDPSREKALEVALEVERLARQQAEREREESEEEIWQMVLRSAQQAWPEPHSYGNCPTELITEIIDERDELRAQLTLSEQARAQAEQERVTSCEFYMQGIDELNAKLDASEQTRARLRTALEDAAVIFRAIEALGPEHDAEADRQADRIGDVLERIEKELSDPAGATTLEKGATESAQSLSSSTLTVPQETTTDETP